MHVTAATSCARCGERGTAPAPAAASAATVPMAPVTSALVGRTVGVMGGSEGE